MYACIKSMTCTPQKEKKQTNKKHEKGVKHRFKVKIMIIIIKAQKSDILDIGVLKVASTCFND